MSDRETDTSPDPRTHNCVLFLGAEGLAESAGQTWLRPATPAEVESFRIELAHKGPRDFNALGRDHIGRFYEVVVVDRDAPLDIWLRASSHLRCVRLTD